MTEKKTKRFPLLLSPSERYHLDAVSAAVGLSPSAYLRMLLLNEKPRASSDQKLARQGLADLGRMGGNLNQIAKHLNQGQVLGPERVAPALRGVQNAVEGASDAICNLLEGRTNDN